jgi:hypothetical protein
LQKDTIQFLRAWKSRNKDPDTPDFVAGKSNPGDIASEFKEVFAMVYINSAHDVAAVEEFTSLHDFVTNSNTDPQCQSPISRCRCCLFASEYSSSNHGPDVREESETECLTDYMVALQYINTVRTLAPFNGFILLLWTFSTSYNSLACRGPIFHSWNPTRVVTK